MEKEKCLRELALPLLGKWSIFIVLMLAEEEMYFAQLEREIGIVSNSYYLQKRGIFYREKDILWLNSSREELIATYLWTKKLDNRE